MKKPLQYKKGIYLLPSLFTTGNVFCGFYAFIAVFNDMFYTAAWAIVFAIIFDVLDGRVARLTNTTSEFGEQYDSLADIISFGMAPAFLAYAWVLKPYGRLGWMAAFLFLLCGALRLTRFNISQPDVKSQHFVGLPIPGAAAVIASIIIVCNNGWKQVLKEHVQCAEDMYLKEWILLMKKIRILRMIFDGLIMWVIL